MKNIFYIILLALFMCSNASADTTTLRPDSAGDSTQWDLGAGASNYEAVDEESQDSDTTYVYQSAESAEDDLYNITTDASLEGSTINSVTIYAYAKSVKSGVGACSVASLYLLVKAGTTTDASGSNTLTTSYAQYSNAWNVNPDDSASWEKADIDALQIGIRSEQVDGSGSSKHTPYVTQVYVIVDYTEASGTRRMIRIQCEN